MTDGKKGYARAGRAQLGKPQPYIIQYLKSGPISDIEEGRAIAEGRNADGSIIAYYEEAGAKAPPTQWNLRSHNAEHYGTKTLRALLQGRKFPFPKSLYAVEDVLRLFCRTQPFSHRPQLLRRLRHQRPRCHASESTGWRYEAVHIGHQQ